MLKVENAWNQEGWTNNGHLVGNKIEKMIGRTYSSRSALKRAAQRYADCRAYPSVEFNQNGKKYLYDGSPANIPGRDHVEFSEC